MSDSVSLNISILPTNGDWSPYTCFIAFLTTHETQWKVGKKRKKQKTRRLGNSCHLSFRRKRAKHLKFPRWENVFMIVFCDVMYLLSVGMYLRSYLWFMLPGRVVIYIWYDLPPYSQSTLKLSAHLHSAECGSLSVNFSVFTVVTQAVKPHSVEWSLSVVQCANFRFSSMSVMRAKFSPRLMKLRT